MSELLKTKEKLEGLVNSKIEEFNAHCKQLLELAEELTPVEYLIEKCDPKAHKLIFSIDDTLKKADSDTNDKQKKEPK